LKKPALVFLFAIAFTISISYMPGRRAFAEETAQAKAAVRKLPPDVLRKMNESGSLKPGCPVPAADLRLVKVPYVDFDGRSRTGDLVVHKTVAKEVGAIFVEIYRMRFPIDKIRLIDEYGASDDAATADDNTSAFNCRPITGLAGQFSKHSYGVAIDINPFLNPYIRPKTEEDKASFTHSLDARAQAPVSDALNAFCVDHFVRCLVLPDAAQTYVTRDPGNTRSLPKSAGIILRGSTVYNLFKKYGWTWGGDWPADSSDRIRSDYQHFEKPLPGGR
jgi:hypothetical protein